MGGAAEAGVQGPEHGVAGGADLGDDRGDGLGDVRGGGGAAVERAEGGREAGVVVVAEGAHGRGWWVVVNGLSLILKYNLEKKLTI